MNGAAVVQLVGGGHALWVIVQRLLPLTRWTVAVPVLGAIIFAVTWGHQPPTAVLVMVGLLRRGVCLTLCITPRWSPIVSVNRSVH